VASLLGCCLQGQLYVFSSVMVFHANLLAVIKVERIQFKVRHCWQLVRL
jgi:hypothetical protein